MIKLPYNVSKHIAKKVNYHIYSIINLFLFSCEGLDYETFLLEVFPPFYYRTCCKTHNPCIMYTKKSTTLEIIYSDQST
jgi:hypothetical protein